jgi:protein-S-isoprenylcysteine O-methyltransferase Ste14
MSKKTYNTIYVLVYLFSFLFVVAFAGTLPHRMWMRPLGFSLIGVGIVIWLISRLTLKEQHKREMDTSKLVCSGIYSKIRHPGYIGVQILYFGVSILIESLWGLVISLFIVLPLHIVRGYLEEREFKKEYGKRYEKYCKNTWF